MTPERIEEIKGCVKTLHNPELYSMDAFHNAADIMDERKVEWIVELLAALEESQQQRDITQTNYKTYYAEAIEVAERLEESQQEQVYAKQQAIYWNDEAVNIKRQLTEAQQTIARQDKVMKEAGIALNAAQLLTFFIEKDGKPVDGFRFREIARNMMTLLELMDWSALGNKEGSDKACTHENVRNTGYIMVLSDGYEAGIAVCKDCGKKVPEKDEEGETQS
ncbi:hypothetical protein ACFWMP_25395 [Paenibacillus sp. NPDC058367]|uniref:hypothetical protein n=1 Tax=Paenibacillus sp. NPDC058367 TaxID=3346460 RepID=UPI003659117A